MTNLEVLLPHKTYYTSDYIAVNACKWSAQARPLLSVFLPFKGHIDLAVHQTVPVLFPLRLQ